MNELFVVRGLNWELVTVVDTEVYTGISPYHEAATKAIEALYKEGREHEATKIRIFDDEGNEIPLGSSFSIPFWRNCEGFLPAPDFGDKYIMVRKFERPEFSAVDTVSVLRDACLLDLLTEVEEGLTV